MKIITFSVLFVAFLAIAFRYSVDVRYTLSFLATLGYLDFLGGKFLVLASKCLAECSTYYLKRDFQPNEGRVIKIHEFDCSKGVTMEKFKEETQNFTIPAICRGLLKGSKCTEWSVDYFAQHTTPEETFRSYQLDPLDSNRRAFMKYEAPTVFLSANETLSRIKNKEHLYISFDNTFLTSRHTNLVKDMELDRFFPGAKFFLNTLFVSNFRVKTLGSPMHFAPNDNFFFQCKGKKHWFYLKPKDLKYVGAYISRGVGFSSNFMSEEEILNRLTIFEGIIEETDVMYNPPFWMHAVGTSTGETFSVANRAWRTLLPPPDNYFVDLMYKINFPGFVSSIIWTKFFHNVKKLNSLTLQGDALSKPDKIDGGLLTIVD